MSIDYQIVSICANYAIPGVFGASISDLVSMYDSCHLYHIQVVYAYRVNNIE